MNYRVVFRERRSEKATGAANPVGFLQGSLSDNVVRKSSFVARKGPEVKSSSDPVEADEELSGLGTETWEYEVAEGKDQEFKDALLNSGSMIEFTPIRMVDRE